MTWLNGREVGHDPFGNRYYEDKRGTGKRWVVYQGIVEGSKVPPEWNRWLHHTTDQVPAAEPRRHDWELDHLPNLTGTVHAYRPAGHVSRGGHRPRATGDYQPWRPD